MRQDDEGILELVEVLLTANVTITAITARGARSLPVVETLVQIVIAAARVRPVYEAAAALLVAVPEATSPVHGGRVAVQTRHRSNDRPAMLFGCGLEPNDRIDSDETGRTPQNPDDCAHQTNKGQGQYPARPAIIATHSRHSF